MTDNQPNPDARDEALEDDILAVYGRPESDITDLSQFTERRRQFAPWHHPVKQIVRDRQWADLTSRLLQERPAGLPQVLRYFTLPGQDLFDIKVLTEICAPLAVKIEYFGFNSGTSTKGENGEAEDVEHTDNSAPWVTAESALRQAGRITPEAIIHSDRLEDIALDHSHAAMQLRLRPPFDVINIDACDHLAYAPKGRERNTFDALQALLSTSRSGGRFSSSRCPVFVVINLHQLMCHSVLFPTPF
jgi:hypothetical protein